MKPLVPSRLLRLAILLLLLIDSALGKPPAEPAPRMQSTNSPLFIQEGVDPTFAELLKNGILKPRVSFSKGPVLGSNVRINHALLSQQVGKIGAIPEDIGLHTQACGDSIRRANFRDWTRWYQEDRGVQIFRLFQGEQNIRGGIGQKGSPGRVECYVKPFKIASGAWAEWEGTYTIVKPIGGCIFQLFQGDDLWTMHIDMTADGEIHFLRRRPAAGLEREVSIAQNMVGKSISIKVKTDGGKYEVYKKSPVGGAPWQLVTKGSNNKGENNQVQFRWGIYCGSRKGSVIPRDGLMFVTGVAIR